MDFFRTVLTFLSVSDDGYAVVRLFIYRGFVIKVLSRFRVYAKVQQHAFILNILEGEHPTIIIENVQFTSSIKCEVEGVLYHV